MKNGKKPTRHQRKFLENAGYDPMLWLVVKDTPTIMEIVSRETQTIEQIPRI